MQSQIAEIRDKQKETWNKFSPGWRKWDKFTMNFLKPMGDEIVRLINPKKGETVLDVASGTGEPGLTIASLLGNGKVVMTDLSEGMLDIARDNAATRGIKNIDTIVCDVSELPFAANSFDAVSCRMGFMFFPDMQLAANEMARVLKPGGRIATCAWASPEKNSWLTVMSAALQKYLKLQPPAPGAPGIFRCAEQGLLVRLFEHAGLKNISETQINGPIGIEDPEMCWSFHTEVAAPVAAALAKVDDTMKKKIKNEVFEILQKKVSAAGIKLEYSSWVVYAEK